MATCQCKVFVTLMAGAFLGVLLSPISLWLLVHGDNYYSGQQILMCGRSNVAMQSLSDGVATSSSPVPTGAPRTADLGSALSAQLVYVAVLVSPETSSAVLSSIFHTWGTELGKHFGMFLFSQGKTINKSFSGLPVTILPSDSEDSIGTPVHLQNVALVQYLVENKPSLLSEYKYLFLVQDDIFVHVNNLQNFLQIMNPLGPLYAGLAGNNGYCSGQFGIILNQAALRLLQQYVGKCLLSSPDPLLAEQADVGKELGRCMHTYLDLQCTKKNKVSNTI